MRLFIGIDFNQETIELIDIAIKRIQSTAEKGRFVRPDMLHLTVEFLGEVEPERVKSLEDVIDELKFKPFSVKPITFGTFKRREGDILWMGLEESKELQELWRELHCLLLASGFKLEVRPYIPHVTLGRKVKLPTEFNDLERTLAQNMPYTLVERIHLFHSTSENGSLEYRKIYSGRAQSDN